MPCFMKAVTMSSRLMVSELASFPAMTLNEAVAMTAWVAILA